MNDWLKIQISLSGFRTTRLINVYKRGMNSASKAYSFTPLWHFVQHPSNGNNLSVYQLMSKLEIVSLTHHNGNVFSYKMSFRATWTDLEIMFIKVRKKCPRPTWSHSVQLEELTSQIQNRIMTPRSYEVRGRGGIH